MHPHMPPPTLPTDPVQIDALIIGGGIAGCWTLDRLTRAGRSAVLIEKTALGSGQTIWSQGILHSGLKYTLAGSFNKSARAIREMPAVWRACLAGESDPDLSPVALRSEHCHLWRTDSLSSRAAMIGAAAGLVTKPVDLAPTDRPEILRDCPGKVARLDEQVIEPASLIARFLELHHHRIIRADIAQDALLDIPEPGVLRSITIQGVTLAPRTTIITAAAGAPALAEVLHLPAPHSQTRPLRMVLARSASLPPLNAHCVDGMSTRVTITSTQDASGRTIWQIGGEVAEQGALRTDAQTIALARAELAAVLPSLDLSTIEFATYEAPRAESRTKSGKRPESVTLEHCARTIFAWPSKLVLAPQLADDILAALPPSENSSSPDALADALAHLPRSEVAIPPWETASFSR